MKKLKQIIIPVILGHLFLFIQVETAAQNSISISSLNSVQLEFAAPLYPGSPVESVLDNGKWLNYTVTVSPPDPLVSISVEIESGNISEGLQIQLQAGTFNGTGGGDPGVPAGILTLSHIPQVLIDNIGTCDTGTGPNVGHQLTYRMSISDYSALQASYSTVNILFTITQ